MNIQPNNQSQSISDDQELAKVLAGVDNQADDSSTATLPPEPVLPPVPMPDAPAADELAEPEAPVAPSAPEPISGLSEAPTIAPASGNSALETIKQQALGELRPLVDKLEVSPEEKFDTYLLLLRSTDDQELIAPAHEAAKNITDEARRAQALLDIIKEIDFLSQNQKSQ